MMRGASTIGCLGLGAGLMYLMDSEAGRRRRARVRDRLIGSLSDTEDAIGKTARDVGNRLAGNVAEVKMMLMPSEQISDDVLIARVRARLGRVLSHPHAVTVAADKGRIVLRGPILAAELADAVNEAAGVRGVREVENRLEPHADAGDVPGLQGEGRRMSRSVTVIPENWTPTGRMMSGLVGGGLAISAMRRGGLIGTLLGAGGLALLYRAITNRDVSRLVGVGMGKKSIGFHKTISIHAPIDEVFSLWNNPENFPQFMSHLAEVRRIDERRHRWIANGPAGVPVEWESVITRAEPNAVMAWESVPGSMVETHGAIHFEPMRDGGTRVDINLQYTPPAGALGHAVASLFGTDPKSAMDDDLVRLKSLLEDGKTSASGHRVTLDQVTVTRQATGTQQDAGTQKPGNQPPAGPTRQAG